MLFTKTISKADMVLRYDKSDIERILGRELKEKGFNLDMELTWEHEYCFETKEHTVAVFQEDRFKVRGKFEVIPSAII